MHASSAKLRVECLETRRLLSATALPGTPTTAALAATAPAALLGEQRTAGDHAAFETTRLDATPASDTLVAVTAMFTPEKPSPAVDSASATPTIMGGQVQDPAAWRDRQPTSDSAGSASPTSTLPTSDAASGDSSYVQMPTGKPVQDLAVRHDLRPTSDAAGSASPDSASPASYSASGDASYAQVPIGTPIQDLAVPRGLRRVGDPSDLSAAASIAPDTVVAVAGSPGAMLGSDAGDGDVGDGDLRDGGRTLDSVSVSSEGGSVAIVVTVEGIFPTDNIAEPRYLRSAPRETDPQTADSPATPDQAEVGNAANAPPPVAEGTALLNIMDSLPMIDIFQVNRGLTGFRPGFSRAGDDTPQPTAAVDFSFSPDAVTAAPIVMPALAPAGAPLQVQSSPAKLGSAALSTVSEVGRTSDSVAAAVETSLPATATDASPATSPAVFSDLSFTNSSEGGLIFLDAPVASQSGNLPANNSNTQFSTDVIRDQDLLQFNILPGGHLQAGGGTRSETVRSEKNNPADALTRLPPAIVRSVADADEGGGILLPVEANSATVQDPAANDAAEQLAATRAESGTWLFCDLEIADSPVMPVAGSVSEKSLPHAGFPGEGIHDGPLRAAPEPALSPAQPARPSLTGMVENLPLLLGVSLLVSRGGLRLEEEIPEHDRRLGSSQRQ